MKNNNFTHTLKNKYKEHYGLTAFLLGLLISALLFIPVIIENSGVFLYYGDFNVQQIPFYQMIHDAFQSGNTNWSSTTDLGSATLASYSFYLVTSPFFLFTLLFPGEAVPFLMGPLFMLKFALCSFTAYLYLKRYVKNEVFAVAGALLYAFSGFSIYNIFFFHFHEAMILFPLLLYCVDEFMYNNRRGVLAAVVFISCTVNYYFFAGMAVFIAIYWLMLVFTGIYKLTLSNLLLFIFETVLGVLASAFILFPTILFINGNPRLSEFPDGYNALTYEKPQRYFYIVLSFFFPPELAAEPNFAPGVDADWASVSGWLPLAGMTGVIGYLQLKKRDWLKKLILLLIVISLIPVLNSAFQLFNVDTFYTRWYYMLTLIMSLATIKALEDKATDWKRALMWSVGITVGIALLIGLMPESVYDEDGNFEYTKIGLAENLPRYWIYVAVALLSLLLFGIIVLRFKNSAKKLSLSITAGIILITLVSSTYIVQTGAFMDGSDVPFIRKNLIGAADSVKLKDIKSARSDFYKSIDNSAMYLNIPSIQAFHSVVTPSIMEFYKSLGVTRDVFSEPETGQYGLRGLLSCKYLFCDNRESFKEDGRYLMPGWSYLKKTNGYKVYKNDYYIPMGFMYESFITKKEFKSVEKDYKSEAYLKAMVLSAKDIVKYSQITGYGENDIKNLYEKKKFKSKTDSFEFGREKYLEDCNKLKKNSCSDFRYTNEGFKAKIYNRGKDNLLFFSVPYDEGWSAYVNGKKSEIVKANYGFMAVSVKGNKQSEIVFKYNPPGFLTGIIITTVCGIIYFMYISALIIIEIFRRRKQRAV